MSQSKAEEELRMSAYYYSFVPTGCRPIDEILSAVATAGERYHHTEDWKEHEYGPSCVDVIQAAAVRAAAALDAARREQAERDAQILEEIIYRNATTLIDEAAAAIRQAAEGES